jgi:hypothetical protein
MVAGPIPRPDLSGITLEGRPFEAPDRFVLLIAGTASAARAVARWRMLVEGVIGEESPVFTVLPAGGWPPLERGQARLIFPPRLQAVTVLGEEGAWPRPEDLPCRGADGVAIAGVFDDAGAQLLFSGAPTDPGWDAFEDELNRVFPPMGRAGKSPEWGDRI